MHRHLQKNKKNHADTNAKAPHSGTKLSYLGSRRFIYRAALLRKELIVANADVNFVFSGSEANYCVAHLLEASCIERKASYNITFHFTFSQTTLIIQLSSIKRQSEIVGACWEKRHKTRKRKLSNHFRCTVISTYYANMCSKQPIKR